MSQLIQKKNPNIDLPMELIKEFCHRWEIQEFALFGSVLRDDFTEDSDIDILVSFNSNSHPTLFDLVKMENELKIIFNREIDLVSKRGIENSRNYLRRQEILHSYQVIYAQR